MHYIYKLLGHIICHIFLLYWIIYDLIIPLKAESILFVAHPDDDTLFFHSFIKENKPYVVLLFTGWSLRRMVGFFKVMKKYKVRYRAYDTVSSGAYNDAKRRKIVERHVQNCLRIKNFKLCATHNEEGEYGHSTHKLVHEVVLKVVSDNMPVLVPVDENEINNHPLPHNIIMEKNYIFNTYYDTESWVLEQYASWVKNEELVISNKLYKN